MTVITHDRWTIHFFVGSVKGRPKGVAHLSGPRVDPEDEPVEVVRASDYEGAVSWLSSDEAFEVAWRGAKSCGVGKMSPAQLTAALNALATHLGGQ